MLSLGEVRRFVLGACRPLDAHYVPLDDALGQVLAEEIEAAVDVPGFANSAMDGYAIRAADTAAAPVRLRVVDHILAGDQASTPIGPGEAARIMTGAPMPAGADSVGIIEQAEVDPDHGIVVITRPVQVAENVRYPGEDVSIGDQVFAVGSTLSAAHVAVLAALGVHAVLVRRRPRVGIMSTGNELVAGLGPLGAGQIRDANRPGLLAKVRADGWEPVDLGRIEDDESSLVEAFGRGGATCDAVVATGGVSVGDRDLVKVALDEVTGRTARSVQIAVKPAKPFAFGTLPPSGVPAFGLPGNPVSAFVAYELLVRPALRAMSGCTTLDRPLIPAMAAGDFIRRPDGKIHFVRAVVTAGGDGVLRALSLGSAGPHLLRTMANANALAVLPDGPTVPAGQRVELLLLDADRLNDPPGSHW